MVSWKWKIFSCPSFMEKRYNEWKWKIWWVGSTTVLCLMRHGWTCHSHAGAVSLWFPTFQTNYLSWMINTSLCISLTTALKNKFLRHNAQSAQKDFCCHLRSWWNFMALRNDSKTHINSCHSFWGSALIPLSIFSVQCDGCDRICSASSLWTQLQTKSISPQSYLPFSKYRTHSTARVSHPVLQHFKPSTSCVAFQQFTIIPEPVTTLLNFELWCHLFRAQDIK